MQVGRAKQEPWPKKGAINFSEIVSHDEKKNKRCCQRGSLAVSVTPESYAAAPPPFLNPLKSYGGQPGRRRFGLDDDEE